MNSSYQPLKQDTDFPALLFQLIILLFGQITKVTSKLEDVRTFCR